MSHFRSIVVLAVGILLSLSARAQADRPFLPEERVERISVARRTVLYPFDEFEYDRYDLKRSADERTPYCVYLSDLKSRKVSRDCTMDVVGFARTEERTGYDLYIVRDAEGLYYLEAASCSDRSLLEDFNAGIPEGYEALQEELASKRADFEYRLTRKLEEIRRDRVALEEWNRLSPARADSAAAVRADAMEAGLKERYDAWYAGLSPSAKRVAKFLRIEASELGRPNDFSGCDYSLWYDNLSQKTVKYLNWNGNVYNAVGDRVSCEIRRTGQFSGRSTGPVGPGERGGGVWEAVVYNWSAKEMRLSGIRIQYMDGSTVSVTGEDAVAVTGGPLPFVTAPVRQRLKNEALAEYRNQYRSRKEALDQREGWAGHPDRPADKVRDYFAGEIALRDEIRALEKEVSQYARRNYL